MTVNISSSGEWDRILSSSAVVVTDFYADWCGPCKVIAPTFESLSTKYSKPGKIAFCKVNVDNQRDIASKYSVRAMPTFIIFKSGSEYKRIQGADPNKLSSEVAEAVKLAGNVAGGASFTTPGRTLGGQASKPSGSSQRLGGRSSWSFPSFFNFFNAVITFFGLYLVSLFTFDPYKSAQNSDFNVNKPRAPPAPIKLNSQRAGGAGGAPRPGVRTLADLGGS